MEIAETIQPEITCPMTFNWFPFDTQYCYLLMEIRPYGISLTNPQKVADTVMLYHQNIVLDYKVEFFDLPDDQKRIRISEVRLIYLSPLNRAPCAM